MLHRIRDLLPRHYGIALAGCLIVIMAILWRFSPLQEYLELEYLLKLIRTIRNSPFALPAVTLAYILASFLVLPNTALNVAVVIGIGGWQGFLSALFGSVIAALVLYWLGRKYGTKKFRKVNNTHIQKMKTYLKEGGTVSIILVRQLPIAPFPVINVMAGSMKVRFMPFLIGTIIGLLPGITMVSVFGRQLKKIFNQPEPTDYLLLAALVLVVIAAFFYIKKKATNLDSA